MLNLRDIVHPITEHHTVSPNLKIFDILSRQGLQNHGCLFVTGEDGSLRGIVTDGDIRRILRKRPDIAKASVADAMTPQFVKINEDSPLVEAYRLMAEREIHHLPVVDSKEALIGFVVFHELVQHLSPEHLFIDLADNLDRTDNEQRHIYRYKFATNFIRPNDKVLDCACGSGYGSRILSNDGAEVLGVDSNRDAITFANQHYAKSSVKFMVDEISELTFPDASFDVIVSLETLEHVPNEICRKYLSKIASWLKPKGLVVSSSPMLRYKDGKPYVTNPYHINELPKAELLTMFKTYLPNLVLQFYHQDETRFIPLLDEHTGFCILVARKA